jgi:hypothetical protein
MTFTSNCTTTSSSTAYGYIVPAVYSTSQPRTLTPLEWLDAEIERTCAQARA